MAKRNRGALVAGLGSLAAVAAGAYWLKRSSAAAPGATPTPYPTLPPPVGQPVPNPTLPISAAVPGSPAIQPASGLGAPQNVSIARMANNTWSVTWSPVAGALRYILIQPAYQDQPEKVLGVTSGTDATLAVPNTNSVWVQALNAAGYGARSVLASVTN
jgi:hypothetical protein